jgi:uncharacterized protein YeaO (DUF488 family)
MIKAKHFLDRIESDDGPRMWIEPIGLTKDLQAWRSVDLVLPHLGPPRDVWEWFGAHPDEYAIFRGQYHEWLSSSPFRAALQRLASDSLGANLTFLHAGDDADHNCATALQEFLRELEPAAHVGNLDPRTQNKRRTGRFSL